MTVIGLKVLILSVKYSYETESSCFIFNMTVS